MKLTKEQLRRIIKEELANLLNEDEFSEDGFYIHEYGDHYAGPFNSLEEAIAVAKNLDPNMGDLQIAQFKDGMQLPGTTVGLDEL